MKEQEGEIQRGIEPFHNHELEQNHKIAVATTTFYKGWLASNIGKTDNADQLRGDLAIEAIMLAKDKGYQLVIVDGGSSGEFKDKFTEAGIKIVDQQEQGMSAGRRQTFKEASVLQGVEVICWTEPEKISMIGNLHGAAKPILEGGADIVIPTRTEESYKTYPSLQARSEKRANQLFSQVLRLCELLSADSPYLDVFFGPRIFRNSPEILQLFTRRYQLKPGSFKKASVRPDNYLNTTFFPIILALEQNLRVTSFVIDYIHPPKQTQFETGNTGFDEKRRRQKIDIVSGAIQLARLLIKNPNKLSELLLSD